MPLSSSAAVSGVCRAASGFAVAAGAAIAARAGARPVLLTGKHPTTSSNAIPPARNRRREPHANEVFIRMPVRAQSFDYAPSPAPNWNRNRRFTSTSRASQKWAAFSCRLGCWYSDWGGCIAIC